MDRLLADSTVLDAALLSREEDQYDKRALALATALSRLLPEEVLAEKDTLDVRICPFQGLADPVMAGADTAVDSPTVRLYDLLCPRPFSEHRNVRSQWKGRTKTTTTHRPSGRLIMALHRPAAPRF